MDKDQVQVTVEAAMAEKIARLERQVAQLERERDAVRGRDMREDLRTLLLRLRIHATPLIYVGSDIEGMHAAMLEEYGQDVTEQIFQVVFDLDKAPLPDRVKLEIREACDYGNRRWM